ncbi:putative inactive serine/threonine-protein kinase scy1 [Cocos nucifera]|nr:putative inactive serine/threonine-protein kinase scy1 [Cocos nucifera]
MLAEYFHNKLVETIQFMEILNLKDSVEKDSFFRKLPNLAEQLPRQIVLKKLLPLLASALEFGSAAAPALTSLLKMGSWLSAEEFSVKVLPTIVKLFASNDRAIRVGLLQHIDQFGESLSAQIVDEQFLCHMESCASIKFYVSILGLALVLYRYGAAQNIMVYAPVLTHVVSANYFRIFVKISFKVTGIMALSATSSYYDMMEIATRILPNIVVLTIDPDGDVRTKAFQAVDQFLLLAKQHHEKLITGDTSETASVGTPLIPGNASLLGWAMSSLTLKGKASEHAPLASANANASQISTTSNANSGMDAQNVVPIHGSSGTNAYDQPRPSSPTSTDGGWGELENGLLHEDHDSDKDGWDDVDPVEEQKPPPLASIQAAQKRPVVQAKPAASSMRPKTTLKPSKAEDDDLWGAVAAPAPKTASRSLNVKPASSQDDDDLWGSIAAPPPKTTTKPLNLKTSMASDDSDPWAAIAAPPPSTKAKPLSLGRGRGAKPAPAKLGAQRIDRTSSSGL